MSDYSLFLSIVVLATERKVCPILMTGIGSFQEGNVLDYDSKSGTVHLELTIESLKKAQGKTAVLCVCNGVVVRARTGDDDGNAG